MVIVITKAIKNSKNEPEQISENNNEQNATEEKPEKKLKVWQIILYLVLGLAAVVFGGECVCSTSQFIALKLGMSEALVGLTIVAVGTSLPELVTSIVAAKKGQNQIAFGNAVGSNIANIGLIIGLTGTISPISLSSTLLVDSLILLAVTIIFSIVTLSRKKIDRSFGIILVVTYALYLTFAIVRNYCF